MPREIDPAIWAKVVHDISDHAIFLLDPAGYILTWNTGARLIKGYEPEEVIGKHFGVLFPAEDVASHKPQYELKVAESSGRYEEQAWRVRKGGAPFWAHVNLTARRGANGELLGFVKITRDITAEKQAQDALRAGEERYHVLVDSVKDYAIFLLDASGRIRTWNQGAQVIKGYRPEDIIGEHFSRFYTPEDRAAGHPHRLLARAVRDGRVEDEGWRIRKDGTRFWADVVITAIKNPAGELIGFSKVTRDLTERRKSQLERAELTQSNREAAAANRSLEAFSYTVAHDLRAPIRGILALADELAREHAPRLDANGRDAIARLTRTSEKMAALVEDLLNFSRADKGQIHLERVDLGKMAQHIVHNTLQKRDPGRLGDLIMPDDLTVEGDPSLLRIVMDNLLGNAWKFTSTRPRWRIELTKIDGDHATTISIRDNGIGFSPEGAATLFEPFRRLRNAADFPGTGIGLATVRRVIERHGGRVWAEGRPDQGAAVSFTLPKAQR